MTKGYNELLESSKENIASRDYDEDFADICPTCGKGNVDTEGYCMFCGRSAY